MAYQLQYIPRSETRSTDAIDDGADRGVTSIAVAASARATISRAAIDRSVTPLDGTWPELVPVGPGAAEPAVAAGA